MTRHSCWFSCVLGLALTFVPTQNKAAELSAPLQYGFQPGKQYVYEVKIEADIDDGDEIREGLLTYTATKADERQIVLRQTGMLAVRYKARPGSGRIIIPGPPPIAPFPRFGQQDGITINRRGEVILSHKLTPLPYLLGDLEVFVLESFLLRPRQSGKSIATWSFASASLLDRIPGCALAASTMVIPPSVLPASRTNMRSSR